MIVDVCPNLVAEGYGRRLTAQLEDGTVEAVGNMAQIGALVAGVHARDAQSQDFRTVYLHGIR